MHGPAQVSGLLAILLLTACANIGNSAGPAAQVQLTSALEYRAIDEELLRDPFVSMRVQLCEATGGSHCRTLRMPIDTLSALDSPGPVIAFITLHGLSGGLNLHVTCAVTAPNHEVTWSVDLPARTPDDFSPHLPFYRSTTIPSRAFERPGVYIVTVSTDHGGLTQTDLTILPEHEP